MATAESAPALEAVWPDVNKLVTEDDTPVDNIFSEKQQRLLTEPLYASWAGPGEGRPYLALANVGLFFTDQSPLVPDAMLSVDVQVPGDPHLKENRSYLVWKCGKVPDVVIEVVSNDEGGEDEFKLRKYQRWGIPFYCIYDPERHLSEEVFRVFGLSDGEYRRLKSTHFPRVGLGLTLWEGTYESLASTWLRWCDAQGIVIPTGAERADEERKRADEERRRADEERERADEERRRADKLAEQLRAHGIEPAS